MTGTPPPSWTGLARLLAIALAGVPITYAIYYATRLETGLFGRQQVPDTILLTLSIILGGLLAAGLRWTSILRPAGFLAGFIVFGHLVYAAAAIGVSPSFVTSNLAELTLAYYLIAAAGEAGHANPAATH